MGIFKKINFGLTKTRNKMAGAIDEMLDSLDEINEDLYMQLEEIQITDIIPSDYNPRRMSEEEYDKLAKSLNSFGVVDPIIVNLRNNHIIGGHQRYDVLHEQYIQDNNKYGKLHLLRLGDIGWVFPDTELEIKSDDHEKALNLALNKISGEWDEPKLKPLLEDLSLKGFDIELTGFDDLELTNLLTEEGGVIDEFIPEDEPEFDESIADDIETITCPRCGYELPKS